MALFSNKINSLQSNSAQIKKYLKKKHKNDSASLFDKINFDDINAKKLYKSLFEDGKVSESAKKESAKNLESKQNENKLLGILTELFSISDFAESVGGDEISYEEFFEFLDEVSALDDETDDISLEDLERALSYFDLDLEEQEIEQEEEKVEETSPTSTGSAGSLGSGARAGSVGGGMSAGSSSAVGNADKNKEKADTSKEIQNKITQKEKELSDVNKEADAKIKEEQEKYDKAVEESMEANKISQEVQEEYEAQNARLEGEIQEQDTQIQTQEALIQDKDAQISAKTSALSAISAQISSLEGAKQKDKSTDTSDIDGKISNLKAQEEKLNQEIEKAKEEKEKAQTAKTDAETKKQELQQEKDNLLETLQEKYPDEKLQKVIEETQKAQKETKDNIDKIETERKTKVETLNSEIAKLKVELATVKQQEETEKLISENSVSDYNEAAGKKLADAAHNVAGTIGYCLGGVSDTLQSVYGCGLPGLGSAYLAAEALRGNTPGYEEIASHFKEVKTYKSASELTNLPPGAIVVWENGGGANVSAAGKKHGHISIALGNGQESSDHIQNQTTNRDGVGFSVFYPID